MMDLLPSLQEFLKNADTNPLEQQIENVEIFFSFTQGLTVSQIKNVRTLIDRNIAECNEEVVNIEQLRNEKLFEVGNLLHESVPVSNDEVRITEHNAWYSHSICFSNVKELEM